MCKHCHSHKDPKIDHKLTQEHDGDMHNMITYTRLMNLVMIRFVEKKKITVTNTTN